VYSNGVMKNYPLHLHQIPNLYLTLDKARWAFLY
jgi:hypothetical protein